MALVPSLHEAGPRRMARGHEREPASPISPGATLGAESRKWCRSYPVYLGRLPRRTMAWAIRSTASGSEAMSTVMAPLDFFLVPNP